MGDSGARLGIAIGAAVLTTAVGLGPGVGFAVGSLAGGLLFPGEGPNTVTEGPRLGDLAVTSSAYGAAIGRGFGTVRLGGNIIWATPIQEQQNVDKEESGGKGFPSPATSATQVTYSYFGNFAVSFGQGVADDVLRMWADGKLIFDKTGINSGLQQIDEDGNLNPIASAVAGALGLNYSKEGIKFRFYSGKESQPADPLIVADKGAANTPAFRGLAYIVLEKLPLQDYGNRIPSITVELTFNSSPVFPTVTANLLTQAEGGISTGLNSTIVGFDSERGFAYIPSDTTTIVRRINLRTMQEDRQSQLTGSVTAVGFPYSVMYDGSIIGNSGSSNSRPIHRIAPDSLQVNDTFGGSSSGLVNTTTQFVALRSAAPIRALGLDGPVDFVFTLSVFGPLGLLKIQPDGTLKYIWGAAKDKGEGVITSGKIGIAVGEGWLVTDTKEVWRMRTHFTAVPDNDGFGGAGVDFEQRGSITTGTGTVDVVFFDQTDDALIVLWTGGELVKYDPDTTTELWTTTVAGGAGGDDKTGIQSVIRDQRLALVTGSTAAIFDTATGELLDTQIGFVPAVFGETAYNSRTHCMYVRSGSGGLIQWFLQRGGGEGIVLGDIVKAICSDVGLDPVADLDVTDLTDTVPGYMVGRPSTARGALQPLATAYFFGGVESDFQLTFPKQGKAKVLDIPEKDLVISDDRTGQRLPETRTQEVELPESIEVVYLDKLNDYQQGNQRDKRVKLPTPTMRSSNKQKFELPIVLDTTFARELAEKLLYTRWVERVSRSARLPWRYLKLNPSDAVEFTFDNGNIFPTRISKLTVNSAFSLQVDGVSSDSQTLVGSGASADRGEKVPQVIEAPAFTRLFLPNVPLLRDIDDTGRASTRIYYAMGGLGQSSWPGALLFRSADGEDFSQQGQANVEVIYGTTQNILGTTAQPATTDNVNTIRVTLATGVLTGLSSVTNLQMLNGANAALVGTETNGYEVVQFQNAVQQNDGSWILDTLLRGRRGTELLVGTHVAGDDFILLTTATIEAYLADLGEVGSSRFFKGVGYGLIFEDVLATTRTHTGEDLKPYSPDHVAGVVDGGNNVDLSWLRRTRAGGSWNDGIGTVPLAEDTESYEVDVYDAPFTTVLRTLVSVVESVQYDNADIITDFGSVPSTLNVIVYQLSAQVGRGRPEAVTLTL